MSMSVIIKALSTQLLLFVCMMIANTSALAEEPILNIYNWADYIDPQILKDFEKEYGIKINYDIYDSSEMVDTKLLTGRTGYDIVFHATSFTGRLVKIGVFQPVQFDRLSNWHHIDPKILAMIEHQYSGELYGVPYMWGTVGFAYNIDLVKAIMPDAPVNSARMIFDPAIISRFTDCGVSFLDDPTSVIPLAMIYLGYPANSVDTEQLKEVNALLKSVRPYIKYFSSTKMLLDLPSEEVCIAMSWSGEYAVATAKAAEAGLDINLAYTVPIEGSTDWFDLAMIPSDAPHPNNAHLFLDYILRPEVIAAATDFIGYANANKSATALVDKSISGDPAIYPDEETLKRMQAVELLEPKLERKRSRAWTKFKTGL